jgi:hypothetical protein
LLSLGLKKETADMYWGMYHTFEGEEIWRRYAEYPLRWGMNNMLPAWSLHRLWELLIIKDVMLDSVDEIATLYDTVIDKIEEQIKIGYFPKEYLV